MCGGWAGRIVARGRGKGFGCANRTIVGSEEPSLPWYADAAVVLLACLAAAGAATLHVRNAIRLRRARRAFDTLFDWSVDACFLVDADDGKIQRANRAVRRILDYTPADLKGRPFFDVVADESAQGPNLLEKIALQGAVFASHRFQDRHGNTVSMDMTAAIAPWDGGRVIVVTAKEISERRDSELALLESEERFRFLAQATGEGVVVHSQGHVIFANDAYYSMFGLKPEDIEGRDALELTVAPESLPDIRRRIAGGFDQPYETVGRHRSGRAFPILIHGQDKVYHGQPVRVSTVRDMSEENRAREERERLIGELTRQNDELEQFTYAVSHDLKSPLLTIASYAASLPEDLALGDTDEALRRIQRIDDAVERMQALLDGLLEFSRAGRSLQEKAPVQVADLIDQSLRMLDASVKRRGVEVHIGEDLPTVMGDAVRLRQVFQNLIENAIQFMGDREDPRIEIGVRPHERMPVITVCDNGKGIEPRMQERIFQIFVTGRPRGQGTGVGLALARRIAEQHGGSLWVESEGKGKGATFCAALPAAGPHSREDAQA